MKIHKRFYLFLALFSLIAAVFLVRRSQFLSSLAQTPTSVGAVTILSGKVEGKDNTSYVEILFRTGSDQANLEAMSTLGMRIFVSGEGASDLKIVDVDGNQVNEIIPSEELTGTEEWEFPVNKATVSPDGLTIDFAGVNLNKGGYASTEFKKIATFYLESGSTPSEYELKFDTGLSAMYSKRRPTTNIWDVADLHTFRLTSQ